MNLTDKRIQKLKAMEKATACEKCGSKTRMMGSLVVSAPSHMYGDLKKSNLRSRDVQIWGVLWDTFDFVCTNPTCGYSKKLGAAK